MDIQRLAEMYDFTGRTIVVTGGTGVLGTQVVIALADLGAKVVVLHRHVDHEKPFAQQSGLDESRVLELAADVLDRQSLIDAALTTGERFGAIDGLVNMAGGNRPEATTGPDLSFFDLPEEAMGLIFDLNLLGTVLPCQVFGRRMAEQGEGVILNVTSMSGLRPLRQIPAYSAAKAGVANFTQWLAVHMAQEYSPKIRVNAVAPGFFIGEQNRYLLIEPETGELTPRGRNIIAHTPMGRFGLPDDLLGTVLWLLSPASAFVTGITVPVDGGFSAFAGV